LQINYYSFFDLFFRDISVSGMSPPILLFLPPVGAGVIRHLAGNRSRSVIFILRTVFSMAEPVPLVVWVLHLVLVICDVFAPYSYGTSIMLSIWWLILFLLFDI
jgi:hypothetical protein